MSKCAKAHQQALVVGLGKTGYSCIAYLCAQGFAVTAIDSRENPPCLDSVRQEFPEVRLCLGTLDIEELRYFELVVVSPGVSREEPVICKAQQQGIAVLGDIELFARVAQEPLYAITGSNGKSTVTTLVGKIFVEAGKNVAIGGNLGDAALGLLAPEHEAYVLELSSFQLENLSNLQAEVAVILNLSPDHLDRHHDYAAYVAAKARIFEGAKHVVVNLDEPEVVALAQRVTCPTTGFRLGKPETDEVGIASHLDTDWVFICGEPLMPVAELALRGRHNLSNVLAACAIAEVARLPKDAMRKVLASFRGLPHRTQLVGSWNNVDWLDDSKGTNTGATIAAIEGLGFGTDAKSIILIAGGMGKGADFSSLQPAVDRYVKDVILLGQDAPKLKQALTGHVGLHEVVDMQSAVEMAKNLAVAGDKVLLSPACASWDMFRDYGERGDIFAAAAKQVHR